jgi:hypothetical protein
MLKRSVNAAEITGRSSSGRLAGRIDEHGGDRRPILTRQSLPNVVDGIRYSICETRDVPEMVRLLAEVFVREVADEPIYSATGEVSEKFSAAELVDALEARSIPASAHSQVEGIIDQIVSGHRGDDVVLVMSNGSFDDTWEKLLSALRG